MLMADETGLGGPLSSQSRSRTHRTVFQFQLFPESSNPQFSVAQIQSVVWVCEEGFPNKDRPTRGPRVGPARFVAFPYIPVASLPEVAYPTIQVSAQLPGASPDTMASAVAAPLERMFGRIAGITQMTSSSSLGGTSIVLQFDLGRNADAAARNVQAAINAARGQLPANLPTNPNWRKVNPAESPIMVLARVPGATLFMQSLQDVTIRGRIGNAQFQYTLLGDSLHELLTWAPIVEQKLKGLQEIRDASSDLQNRWLQAGLVIDRDTAGRLGISTSTIDTALYDAFGQRDVSVLYEPLNQYHALMEIDPKF